MNTKKSSNVYDLAGRLPEDADERRMFDGEVEKICEGKPLLRVAVTLEIYSKVNPKQGSYAKVFAIMSNECRNGTDRIKALEAEIKHRDKCGSAELAGIAAQSDGEPLKSNPFRSDDLNSVKGAQYQCWEMGWQGQARAESAERVIEAVREHLMNPLGTPARLSQALAVYDEAKP